MDKAISNTSTTPTLADAGARWFELNAVADLGPRGRRSYAKLWRRHVHPRLGGSALAELRPDTVELLRRDLSAEGVRPATIKKTALLVERVLDAQARDEISSNHSKLVGKPAERLNPLRALEPAAVERLRQGFHRRGSTLVAVLAYAGLRPCEALALTWGDVRPRTLMVDGRAPAGVRDHTSVPAVRGVRLFSSLSADLDEWRRESGDPGDEALVFPGRRGAPWDDGTWRKWRRRRFAPAVAAAGLPGELRPYDLRDTLAALLIGEGTPIPEIAQQLGLPALTTLRAYRPLIDAAAGESPRPSDAAIRAARES